MYEDLNVQLISLKGSYNEIGLNQGKVIPMDPKFQILKSLNENVDAVSAQSNLEKHFPGLLEEIRGLADGLNIDDKEAIQMFSGYDMMIPPMGCTSFSDGKHYVRNYDFGPLLYDGRLVFVKPNNGYASIGFSQQITGRLDGMNEAGLVVGLHLVNENHKGKGFIAATIVRMLLDQCKNVEEAADFIQKIPHSYCYNYSLLDRYGNTRIIEATPDKQIIRGGTSLNCTNHFETESIKEKNRPYIEGSLHRKNLIEQLPTNLTSEEAFKTFNEESSPLFFKNYEQFYGTLHTVVYIPESLEVIVGIGGNAAPKKFSISKLLKGEEDLKGELVGKIQVGH